MSAANFHLEDFSPPVPVTLTENITQKQLLEFKPFQNWCNTLKKSFANQGSENHAFHVKPYALESINIESVSWFGLRIGFIKFVATIKNEDGASLPGVIFLRGGSVALLMILRPHDNNNERLVVMTEQPRVPPGSLAFLEIPAGMLDEHQTFRGAAAKEIEEETGITVLLRDLNDMTKLALEKAAATGENETTETGETLEPAMYPSSGGSDEFIPIFLWEKVLDRQQIEEMKGKLTGLRTQGEMIRLRLINYEDLWSIGARDAKTLAAWALYESLKRAGKLPDVS